MTRHKIVLNIEPLPEGGYLVTSPDVPGLLTEGDTFEEALGNVPDAVRTLIEAMQYKGAPLPQALRPVDEHVSLELETAVAVPTAA